MVKHSLNKSYVEWNLINTGRFLMQRFNEIYCGINVIIIKADLMYLKTFSK
jgi:hypothetical protein